MCLHMNRRRGGKPKISSEISLKFNSINNYRGFMALASAIIAAFTLLLVVAAWAINTLRSHEGKSSFIKSLIALIALLFTFGSGLCALGSTIILNPVAILAFAALITSGYACKAVLDGNKACLLRLFTRLFK